MRFIELTYVHSGKKFHLNVEEILALTAYEQPTQCTKISLKHPEDMRKVEVKETIKEIGKKIHKSKNLI